MKKLCFVFAALMTVATLLLVSCASADIDRLSERRSGYFAASDGTYTVTAVSGVREQPYASDGKAGAMKHYTLITVAPVDFDMDAVYTYIAAFGGAEYGGTLTVHPFAASFSAEIDAEATDGLSVTVTCGEKSATFELKSLVTPDMISCDRAIDAAKTALAPSGEYEMRARLIRDPLGGDGLCWHVSVITAESESSVLLDPVTAKVLAKKA